MAHLTENDDQQLVALAKNGDVEAFGALIERHQPAVTGFLMTMVRDVHLAEDCAQQAFLKAFENLGAFEGRSSFRTWVCRIAWNAAKAQWRWAKVRRLVSFGASDQDTAGWAELRAESRADTSAFQALERRLDLERAMEGLSRREREVAALRLEGYALNEIADVLGVTEGTIKSALFEATRKMKERLQ